MVLPVEIQEEFKLENTSTEKITFIIPFRGIKRFPHLVRCVVNVLRRYPGSEIIVIEESDKPVITRPIPGAKYVYAYSRRMFNKAFCFNLGFLVASNDIICGLDCDMIIPSTLLSLNLEHVKNDKVIFPGLDIYYTSIDIDNLAGDIWSGKTWKSSRVDWQFHGGIFICNKKVYTAIGGFDQRFEGHGGEDTSFYLRSKETLNSICTQNIDLIHMEHSYEGDVYIPIELNRALSAVLSKISPGERVKSCKYYNIFYGQ